MPGLASCQAGSLGVSKAAFPRIWGEMLGFTPLLRGWQVLGCPHGCTLGAVPSWNPLVWRCHPHTVLGGSRAVLWCLPSAGWGCRGLWGMDLLGSTWAVVLLMPGSTTAGQKLLFLSLKYRRERSPCWDYNVFLKYYLVLPAIEGSPLMCGSFFSS